VPSEYHFIVKQWLNKKLQLLLQCQVLSLKGVGIALTTAWLSSKPLRYFLGSINIALKYQLHKSCDGLLAMRLMVATQQIVEIPNYSTNE